ncbi:MAG: 2-amino-4-hydroxy-6-hydroxymethyldihydropteridine diphosphokinase [marine bacterium B5-7]|nr:MAG: 2-amino-4-hydroxy-6-hydroxymethyldihydropteridine diphosphokinase [marine bacterium B5-7]
MKPVIIALGIGSNLEKRRHLQNAINALHEIFGNIDVSPVYRSASVGFDGPDFFNLVVVTETTLSVSDLHTELRALEKAEGRTRVGERFSVRSLDIDILLYGDANLHGHGFDIPRGEILEHDYVLKPLTDLLPETCHPQNGRSFGDLWTEYANTNEVNIAPSGFTLI